MNFLDIQKYLGYFRSVLLTIDGTLILERIFIDAHYRFT